MLPSRGGGVSVCAAEAFSGCASEDPSGLSPLRVCTEELSGKPLLSVSTEELRKAAPVCEYGGALRKAHAAPASVYGGYLRKAAPLREYGGSLRNAHGFGGCSGLLGLSMDVRVNGMWLTL